jgi:Radical SAM superfamily
MRLSRFVLSLRDVAPGEHVLYDVIGDRYVGVDGATLEAVARWSAQAPAAGVEAETASALAELGLLVRDAAEDDARLAASRAATAEGMPDTAYVSLMPTLSCNLACTYCFQKDHPAAGRMSAETEAAALAWIERQVVASGARRLVVLYIGGEPLLRKDFIIRTACALSSALSPLGVVFEWELTTNGVGLEVSLLRALSALGRGAVKVTLDGDRETHDAARVFRDGSGSFEAVFESLVAVARACPEVALRIGGNLRPGAGASCLKLLERLESEGLSGRFEWIRFKPILDAEAGCGSSCGSQTADTDELTQLAARRGLAREAPRGIDVDPVRAALEAQLRHRSGRTRVPVPRRGGAARAGARNGACGRARARPADGRAAVGALRRLPLRAGLPGRLPGRALPPARPRGRGPVRPRGARGALPRGDRAPLSRRVPPWRRTRGACRIRSHRSERSSVGRSPPPHPLERNPP